MKAKKTVQKVQVFFSRSFRNDYVYICDVVLTSLHFFTASVIPIMPPSARAAPPTIAMPSKPSGNGNETQFNVTTFSTRYNIGEIQRRKKKFTAEIC